MANEITLVEQLTVLNGTTSESFAASWKESQTTARAFPFTQSIPTTAGGTAMLLGPITSVNQGWCALYNLDTTNYVSIGVNPAGTFFPLLRLVAGARHLFFLEPSVTVYLLANTAAVVVRGLLLQK